MSASGRGRSCGSVIYGIRIRSWSGSSIRKNRNGLLGLEEAPPADWAGEYEITQTIFRGEPAPYANSRLAFFDLTPGVQLELIQPNEYPSTWREFLNEKGEGIHHIAFQVTNMEQVIRDCEAEGMTLVKYGKYGDGSGHYAYMDGNKDFKCVIELLESF